MEKKTIVVPDVLDSGFSSEEINKALQDSLSQIVFLDIPE